MSYPLVSCFLTFSYSFKPLAIKQWILEICNWPTIFYSINYFIKINILWYYSNNLVKNTLISLYFNEKLKGGLSCRNSRSRRLITLIWGNHFLLICFQVFLLQWIFFEKYIMYWIFFIYFIIKFYLTQFKFICNVLCSFGYKQGLIVILNLENNK